MARGEEASAGPPCGFLTLHLLLLAIISVAVILAERQCGPGLYKTKREICCKLCRPGQYKAADCIVDGMSCLCELCLEGTFMDRENQARTCTRCRSCGADEVVTHNCSVAQDTMCQCREGFGRDPDTRLCVHKRTDPALPAAIAMASVFGALVLGGIAALILTTRRRRLPRIGNEEEQCLTNPRRNRATDGDAGDDMVWVLMSEHREQLKEWLGEDPSPLLDNLIETNTITRNVYNAAKAMRGEECVQFLLDHFLGQSGNKHFRLWNALHSVRKNYVQLWRLFNEKGEAVHAITKARPQLKGWIGKKPQYLLLQLINQSLIPKDVVAKVKSANSNSDRAEILLNFFIQRGNDDCEKLLFALNIMKSEYPKAREWLDSLRFLKNLLIKAPLFLARYKDNGLHSHIRFKKKDISRAIEDDLEPLLTCLEKRHYFTKTISQDVALMEQTRGRKAAADHVIELTLGRNQGKSRQFLEVLWELRDQHPKFAPIFNDM